MCHQPRSHTYTPPHPQAIWEPLGGGRREEEPRTSKVSQDGSCILGLRGAPPAEHFHGNQPDLRAGPLPLGADHRSASLRALASLSWGTSAPASIPGLGQTQDLPPTPNRLARCPDLPGRTEGAKRGAGSSWKPSGALAGVRADGGQLQPLMSQVGQAGLAESSTPRAAQRLAHTASARPAAATAPGESYNGHWAGG